jgi:hypothetical protein
MMETRVMADDRGGDAITRHKAKVRHNGLVPTLTPVHQQGS